MKTTIDIPEDLYRRVKAKSALQGVRIRDLTIALYRRWLEEDSPPGTADARSWLDEWLREADAATDQAPPGLPSARDLLEAGRGRLERPGGTP